MCGVRERLREAIDQYECYERYTKVHFEPRSTCDYICSRCLLQSKNENQTHSSKTLIGTSENARCCRCSRSNSTGVGLQMLKLNRCGAASAQTQPVWGCRRSNSTSVGMQTLKLNRRGAADAQTQPVCGCRRSNSTGMGLQTLKLNGGPGWAWPRPAC